MTRKLGEAAKPNGRPPHVPTENMRQLVLAAHIDGATQGAIAAEIGVHPKTLRAYYDAELSAPSPAAHAAASARFKARMIAFGHWHDP